MKSVSIILVSAVAMIATLPPAHAFEGVNYVERVEYYDVSGASLDELAQSIVDNRPAEIGDFTAFTSFAYTWRYNYKFDSSQSVCEITSASAEVEVVLRLPRLANAKRAPKAVREFWGVSNTALEAHEFNHAADFKRIGELLPTALREVTTPDCDAIEAAANAVGDEFVTIAQRLSDEYDHRTDHGINEGVSWPSDD